MMNTSAAQQRGFTVVELIVTSALIVLLAAALLVSLGGAREKGADAGIRSNLANIKGQAEFMFSQHGAYSTSIPPVAFPAGVCARTAGTLFADPNIAEMITTAGAVGNNAGMAQGSCVSTVTAWAVSMPLVGVAGESWCVDSKGGARKVTPSGGDRGFLGSMCK